MELSVFALIVSLTAVQSAIRTGPTNHLKKVGENVELICITDGNGCDQVDWQKVEGPQSPKPVYQSGRGMLNRELFPTARYNVSSHDGCILNIRDLKITDSGRFSCVQSKDGTEVSRSAVLVVVDVTELCQSNVTKNELVEGEGYTLVCAINVPPKSLEPSDVTLSLKKVYDAEKVDYSLEKTPSTVKATYSSNAARENITARSCDAYFLPDQKHGFDQTRATLKICSTQELIVYFPVRDIAVLSAAPYYQGTIVYCTASGYPPPTFKWKRLKTGATVQRSDLMIDGDVGEKYECTAMYTIKGKENSMNITIEVSAKSACGPGCVTGIIIGVLGLFIVVTVVVCVCLIWKCPSCPLHAELHSITRSKSKSGNRSEAGQPLTDPYVNSAEINPPKKPPRTSDAPQDV